MGNSSKILGLKILFGPNYWMWCYDESKLSFITPYYLSEQMSKYAYYLYSRVFSLQRNQPMLIWDMFGGIGTDSIYLSRFFNVISTELDPYVYQIACTNARNFGRMNINLINDNCINMLDKIHPDIIYYDPPWGETYKAKTKNFDFSQVYIDYPIYQTDKFCELPKRINCLDLLKYLHQRLTCQIVVKSPLNSTTFEIAFQGNVEYVHKCPNKNLKFIYLSFYKHRPR